MPFTLVLISFVVALFKPELFLINQDQYDIISNLVFFNQAHVLLTFFLLFSVDHYSEWRKSYRALNLNFNKIMAVFLIGSFAIYELFYFDFLGIGRRESMKLYLVLYAIIGTYHFMFQSYGFSVFISRGSGDTSETVLTQLKTERFYLKLLFLLTLATIVTVMYQANIRPFYFVVCAVIFVLAAFCLVMIYKSIKSLPEHLKTKKNIFAFRYLLNPVKVFSPWIGLSAVIIHTWEYIYFIHHSLGSENKKSRLSKAQFLIFLGAQLAFAVLILFTNSRDLKVAFNLGDSLLLNIMQGSLNAVILTHFFVDGLAYSSKHNSLSHRLLKYTRVSKDIYSAGG
ncbi:hypothetical protein K2P97_12320 [bacterium]|nr:hypothetical protein [bacterium]